MRLKPITLDGGFSKIMTRGTLILEYCGIENKLRI